MTAGQEARQTRPNERVTRELDSPTPYPAEILVVDDLPPVRQMLAQHVLQMGHHVTQASNGREALELLYARRFDLVLLDIMMPEMNGHEALDKIKSDVTLRDIPVVMVSAVDEYQSVVRCIRRGAEDYLPKPFEPTLLRARVGACLEKKRLWDELQQKYDQLQDLENLRDSLTDMIVHDLRTPLTSFLTGLQTLPLLGELNDDQQEFLQVSVEGGEMLLSMINDLLDISKMESGSLELEIVEVQVEDLIESAVRQVKSLADAKDIQVQATVPAGLPPFHGDRDKLSRTLVNLLGNAIKFTPEGGSIEVTVRSREADATMEFAVTDTGEGIPPEAHQRIFDKFGQVETRKSGRRMSTGLGLTFCKMAVEAHGGQIGVDSATGRGSTFTFTVPVR